MSEIQYSRFAIDETPYCIWDWDLNQQNMLFVNSIDPDYFRYTADVHEHALQGDDRQYAALALRATYSQGLETLFALLCALVQAPDCVVGWVSKYRNNELEQVVKKIDSYKPVLSKLDCRPVTWENLSAIVHKFNSGDPENDLKSQHAFARLWSRFASDFLNDNAGYEYNSIKHGFRLRIGGSSLAIGLETEPGVPATPEAMRVLGSSEFGTTFFVPERIGSSRQNIRVKSHSRNWNPENFVHALHLISVSIFNIVTFLKAMYGEDSAGLRMIVPTDETYFDEPWNRHVGMSDFNLNPVITESHIKASSPQEILAVYRQEDD